MLKLSWDYLTLPFITLTTLHLTKPLPDSIKQCVTQQILNIRVPCFSLTLLRDTLPKQYLAMPKRGWDLLCQCVVMQFAAQTVHCITETALCITIATHNKPRKARTLQSISLFCLTLPSHFFANKTKPCQRIALLP